MVFSLVDYWVVLLVEVTADKMVCEMVVWMVCETAGKKVDS